MSREIFVDTGAWLALTDASDRFHREASTAYPTALKAGNRLVTTNVVIAETYNLLRRRVGYPVALQFLETLRSTPRLGRIYSNQQLEVEAEAILRNSEDQDFSYADAVSFAAMRAREIDQAFAFDHHFLVAGFRLIPAGQ